MKRNSNTFTIRQEICTVECDYFLVNVLNRIEIGMAVVGNELETMPV